MTLRIVVLGMMGYAPFGGQTWLYLNWLRGLKGLGHEVLYVEDHELWPYDPVMNTTTDDCAYAVRHIARCMEQIGLENRWAFRFAGDGRCWGLTEKELRDVYRSCDVLLNIVGITELKEGHPAMAAPFRMYVETDPTSDQLRIANGDDVTRKKLMLHHAIATYGENYGASDCGVPVDGITYIKIRQPVDLELWPMAYDAAARTFTTIGNYRHDEKLARAQDVYYKGSLYHWSKHHEWEKFLELPLRTSQSFEMATTIKFPEDLRRLDAHGWKIVPALPMTLDVFGDYPHYFRTSRAEFTVAKDTNVRLRSGWFSERDACYLASGKPVVAQETGFSNVLPTGEGLFAFTTMDEALAAVDAINGDYRRNCEAARAIAEEYFEARKVAGSLIDQIAS